MVIAALPLVGEDINVVEVAARAVGEGDNQTAAMGRLQRLPQVIGVVCREQKVAVAQNIEMAGEVDEHGLQAVFVAEEQRAHGWVFGAIDRPYLRVANAGIRADRAVPEAIAAIVRDAAFLAPAHARRHRPQVARSLGDTRREPPGQFVEELLIPRFRPARGQDRAGVGMGGPDHDGLGGEARRLVYLRPHPFGQFGRNPEQVAANQRETLFAALQNDDLRGQRVVDAIGLARVEMPREIDSQRWCNIDGRETGMKCCRHHQAPNAAIDLPCGQNEIQRLGLAGRQTHTRGLRPIAEFEGIDSL